MVVDRCSTNPQAQHPAPANPTAPPFPPMAATPAQADEKWLQSRPKLRPELRFEIRHAENQVNYVLEDGARNRFFQIGAVEFEFVQLLNGQRTAQQALELVNRQAERLEPTAAQNITHWLTNANLLHTDCLSATERIIKNYRQVSAKRWMMFVNPVTFKIPLFNPDRLLHRLNRFSAWFFSRRFFAVWLAITVYAGYLLLEHSDKAAASSIGILSGTRWIWLLLCWVGLKVLHELGHGLAAKKYGAPATETGVLMLLFTPLAYIDVSSSWRLQNRWHRIVISSAGMYVEIFVAALAVICWANTTSQLVADVCFNLYIMAGITTILFNANPLMRFDGYYILSDILGFHNFYSRAQKLFATVIKNLIGMPAENIPKMTSKQLAMLVYGFLSFFWKISISAGLILGAAALFGGFGLIFAITGTILWVCFPILKTVRSMVDAARQGMLNRRRFGIAMSSALIVVLLAFHGLRAPAIRSAPAIVHFEDEIPLRTEASGFLQKVFVTDGQTVTQNQPLFQLNNPELVHEVTKLELQIEQAQIQSRKLRYDGQEAESQAEWRTLKSLELQLAERQAEVDSLTIRAPQDGIIFARGLGDQLGSYLNLGDEIATLAKSERKEIVIAFEHTELDGVQANADQAVHLCFAGAPLFTNYFKRINPRASDRPIDVALTAAYGGRLPVKPVSDPSSPDADSIRMLNHYFTGTVRLDDRQSRLLCAGQRGSAYIRTTSQSMGVFAYLQARNWLRRRFEELTQARGY